MTSPPRAFAVPGSAEIAEQVQLLDGVCSIGFGDDAKLMGAWASARNVLGPFKPKEQQTPAAGGAGGSQTPKAALMRYCCLGLGGEAR